MTLLKDELVKKIAEDIENMKKSFQAGCDKIVGKLTALGYEPEAPQGPDEINTAIQNMYDGRYSKGYEDGLANSPSSSNLKIEKKYHTGHITASGERTSATTQTTKGGCFTQAYHTHTSSCYTYTTCGGRYHMVVNYQDSSGHWHTVFQCDRYGNQIAGNVPASDRTCKNSASTLKCGISPITGYKVGCNLAIGALEEMVITYGDISETVVV